MHHASRLVKRQGRHEVEPGEMSRENSRLGARLVGLGTGTQRRSALGRTPRFSRRLGQSGGRMQARGGYLGPSMAGIISRCWPPKAPSAGGRASALRCPGEEQDGSATRYDCGVP